MEVAIYVAAGVCAGLLSGMGVGGGVILIPALTILGVGQKTAQSVNLLYFLPTGAIAVITHMKNRAVEGKVSIKIAAAGVVTAVFGALLAMWVDAGVLAKFFGGFLIIMGVWEIFKK